MTISHIPVWGRAIGSAFPSFLFIQLLLTSFPPSFWGSSSYPSHCAWEAMPGYPSSLHILSFQKNPGWRQRIKMTEQISCFLVSSSFLQWKWTGLGNSQRSDSFRTPYPCPCPADWPMSVPAPSPAGTRLPWISQTLPQGPGMSFVAELLLVVSMLCIDGLCAKTFILTTLSKPRKAFSFQMQKWKRVMSRKTLIKRRL